ncbi:MAG: ATP-grasp domain-containing protein [Ignavibacteriae bacterium]|nr:MAG: ATP-grasp domain-containing protein [Ignavibacteriota bacterium]
MKSKTNVLVFPCGSENAIEIHSALKDVLYIELYGASGKDDHGRFIFKNYIGNVPYITETGFIDFFNSIINKYSINAVFPTHDDISLFFAKNIKNIQAKIAVPGLRQAEICRSKKETYDIFKDYDFCPQVIENKYQIKKLPLFAKPDKGQGSKGSFKIIDNNNIDNVFTGNLVITEYLPGDELTVDCFTDYKNNLKFIGPRKRKRILGGISVNSSTEKVTDEIKAISNAINDKLQMRGLWFYQIKKSEDNKYKLMEISVRTAGTMNLYRGLGVNFPLLTLYDLFECEVEILANDYYLEVDRFLFNRYISTLNYNTVYIDLDDTIIKNNKINANVMMFLYNAKNNNKSIKLITKNISDVSQILDKYSIHKNLFNKIIILKDTDEKYKWIREKDNVIFIDNAFNERKEVKNKLNIPVFDVDAINTLIDWRE